MDHDENNSLHLAYKNRLCLYAHRGNSASSDKMKKTLITTLIIALTMINLCGTAMNTAAADANPSTNSKRITVGSLPGGGSGEINTSSNSGAGDGTVGCRCITGRRVRRSR